MFETMAVEIHVNFLNCDGGSPTSGHYLDSNTGMLTITRPNCYWAVLGWQNTQAAGTSGFPSADYTYVATTIGISSSLNTRVWDPEGTSEVYDPEKLIQVLSSRNTVASVLEVVERFWPNYITDYPETGFVNYAPMRIPGKVYQFNLPAVFFSLAPFWPGGGAPGSVESGTLILLEMYIND